MAATVSEELSTLRQASRIPGRRTLETAVEWPRFLKSLIEVCFDQNLEQAGTLYGSANLSLPAKRLPRKTPRWYSKDCREV